MTRGWKIGIAVIIGIVLSLIGFITGRYSVKVESKTEIAYVTLPPIHDTVYQPKEVEKLIPIKLDTANLLKYCLANNLYSYLIQSSDSIKVVYEKVDTLKILEDWLAERKYNLTLFNNDTLGKLDVDAVVQYNQLQNIGYNFEPTQKQNTVTKEKILLFEPFLGGGLSMGFDPNKVCTPGATVQAGIFIKGNCGFSVEYQYMFGNIQNHIITGQFLYKF